MNEYQVQASIQTAGVIKVNYDQMDEYLNGMELAYKEYTVTEDTIPDAKANRATLNKICDEIETRRKAIKKEFEKPVKSFEAELKQRTERIRKIIKKIDDDLDVYEQKRIAEKRETVKRLYDENIGEYADYLPLESIRNPKWDNKTYSENAIITDIQEAVLALKNDLRTIDSMCSPWQEECKAVYLVSGLASAFQRYKDLQSAKEAAEKAVRGSEQQTYTNTPTTPEKSVEGLVDSERWVFTISVTTKEDAKFIHDTCEMCGYEYYECKEG